MDDHREDAREQERRQDRPLVAPRSDEEEEADNDTTPRYDKAAADLAWSRTVDFFKKNLQG